MIPTRKMKTKNYRKLFKFNSCSEWYTKFLIYMSRAFFIGAFLFWVMPILLKKLCFNSQDKIHSKWNRNSQCVFMHSRKSKHTQSNFT